MAVSKNTIKKNTKKFVKAIDDLESMIDAWKYPDLPFPKIDSFDAIINFQNVLIQEMRKPSINKVAFRTQAEVDAALKSSKYRKIEKEEFEILDKIIKNLISIMNILKSSNPKIDPKALILKGIGDDEFPGVSE